MTNVERDYSLDFIKTICTILIIFHHYQQLFSVKFIDGVNFYGGKFYFGYIVELFFIISGILAEKNIDKISKREVTSFQLVKNKFLTFIPLLTITAITYELLLLIYNAVFDTNFMGQTINVFGTIVTSIGVQAGWIFRNPEINNPVWYISVLLLCYTILCLCVYLSNKIKMKPIYLFILLILMGILIQNGGYNFPFFNQLAARGYIAFFVGVILMLTLNCKVPSKSLVIICLLITIIYPLFILLIENLNSVAIEHTLIFIYYPSLIITLKYSSINKFFNDKFTLLAKISYNAFIWHICVFMIIMIVGRQLGVDNSIYNNYLAMFIATTICYIFGYISHLKIETSICRIIKKYS